MSGGDLRPHPTWLIIPALQALPIALIWWRLGGWYALGALAVMFWGGFLVGVRDQFRERWGIRI